MKIYSLEHITNRPMLLIKFTGEISGLDYLIFSADANISSDYTNFNFVQRDFLINANIFSTPNLDIPIAKFLETP